MGDSAAEWVALIFLMVAVSVITRALETFFVHNGCCESECMVRRRRHANSLSSPRPPDVVVVTPPPSPGGQSVIVE